MNFTPELNELTALSPADGRYRSQVGELASFFSEMAWMKYRLYVETEYFIALAAIPLPQLVSLDHAHFADIRCIVTNFSLQDAGRIKEIERKINHDVKAVEYFLKERLESLGLTAFKEFIHFGLTSQDVNNTAVPLLIREALGACMLPVLSQVLTFLRNFGEQYQDMPMLARTHGQPASPTRLGKEILVFAERLEVQLQLLKQVPFAAKFGGAVGNFNAHAVAYPTIDWHAFADRFVGEHLGLHRSRYTTQIEHYDCLAALFDALRRINTIFVDLNRDLWQYISLGYLTRRTEEEEVGSSVMPHKINPIEFENSEGNLGVANALFEHLSTKLPTSRLQRDLTDSTVLRSIGLPFAHSLIAWKSLLRGLHKIAPDKSAIENDLKNRWYVIAEGIQTILRREGYPNPYEVLKKLTRGQEVTQKILFQFIDNLNIIESVKLELKALSPLNFTGILPKEVTML